MKQIDNAYLDLVLEPIRVCASYKPKFGRSANPKGLSLAQFQKLYRSDPFYHWFGLDNALMYAAHKAAGGMTSIYRQIGIGCEKLFRSVLRDSFGLSDADVRWSYTVPVPNGRKRTLYLDGRIPLDKIHDRTKRNRFHGWMKDSAKLLGVDSRVFSTLTGAIFEVRQGYKSKDSKRQNADIANAAAAYTQAYLPCAAILSMQADEDVLIRYRSEKWTVLTGVIGGSDPLTSTYDFMRDIVGYDLEAFFKRHSRVIRAEINGVLETLLTAEAG